jgi:hypothetical protein
MIKLITGKPGDGMTYGPENPPPLRRDGESVADYRVRCGWDKPSVGGKREGSGRKALDPQGTIVTTIRLTAEQRFTLDALGGVQWLRDYLDHIRDPFPLEGKK